jgi:hypothetical protein
MLFTLRTRDVVNLQYRSVLHAKYPRRNPTRVDGLHSTATSRACQIAAFQPSSPLPVRQLSLIQSIVAPALLRDGNKDLPTDTTATKPGASAASFEPERDTFTCHPTFLPLLFGSRRSAFWVFAYITAFCLHHPVSVVHTTRRTLHLLRLRVLGKSLD